MPFRKKMTEFDGNLWPPEPSLETFREVSFANPVASGPPRRLRSLVVNSPRGSTLTWDMLRGMGDPGGHPIRRRADDPTRCRTRVRRSHRPLPPSGVTATPKRGAAAERACPDLASLPFASRVGPESRGLLVEPEVFEAPAVVNAVDHRSEPVDIRLPTARSPRMINDWSGAVLSQDT